MKALYTKEDMQPAIDFLVDALVVVKDDAYKKEVQKIVDNFDVAYEQAGESNEKRAYLYALYVNNVLALGEYLLSNHLLTQKLGEAFYELPSRPEAYKAIESYDLAARAKRDEVTALQQEIIKHNHTMEIFKGIALGDSVEDAEAKVTAREQEVQKVLQKQQ